MPTAPRLQVRPLLPHEWPVLKQVRLRALADAPDAFCTTLAQAQAYTDSDWQERANRFAANPPAAARIAYLKGAPCGLMTCYPAMPQPPGAGRVAELTAVWVDPVARGQGAAEALAASVIDWAISQDIRTLQAWVMEDNPRALAFYKKVGFHETGQRLPEATAPPRYAVLLTRLV